MATFQSDEPHNQPQTKSGIVVVGSIIMDLAVYTDRLPKAGETLTGKRFLLSYGGKGANQAVMAKILGGPVTLIGKIGNDTFGGDYLNNLKNKNISTSYIFTTDSASTGVAQISVDTNGRNTIIVVPGANYQLSEAEVNQASKVLTEAHVVLCQLEVNFAANLFAMKAAFEKGVFTMLNTAPIPSGFTLQDPIFQYTRLVCANECEACHLAQQATCEDEEQARVCADIIRRASSSIEWVLITMGSQGVFMLHCGEEVGRGVLVPTVKVEAIDTTGAGDAFTGSLAYFIACHPRLSMEDMVKRSCVIAADSVTRVGTQLSYLPRSELDPNLFI